MKLNKRVIGLIMSGMLVLPMVGCDSIKLEETKNEIQEETLEYNDEEVTDVRTSDEAIQAIIESDYSIIYNNQEHTIDMETVLENLFPGCEIDAQFTDEDICIVRFDNGVNYIVYELNFSTGVLTEKELYYNDTLYEDDEAHENILQLIVNKMIDSEYNKVKDETSIKEEKKEEPKEEKKYYIEYNEKVEEKSNKEEEKEVVKDKEENKSNKKEEINKDKTDKEKPKEEPKEEEKLNEEENKNIKDEDKTEEIIKDEEPNNENKSLEKDYDLSNESISEESQTICD